MVTDTRAEEAAVARIRAENAAANVAVISAESGSSNDGSGGSTHYGTGTPVITTNPYAPSYKGRSQVQPFNDQSSSFDKTTIIPSVGGYTSFMTASGERFDAPTSQYASILAAGGKVAPFVPSRERSNVVWSTPEQYEIKKKILENPQTVYASAKVYEELYKDTISFGNIKPQESVFVAPSETDLPRASGAATPFGKTFPNTSIEQSTPRGYGYITYPAYQTAEKLSMGAQAKVESWGGWVPAPEPIKEFSANVASIFTGVPAWVASAPVGFEAYFREQEKYKEQARAERKTTFAYMFDKGVEAMGKGFIKTAQEKPVAFAGQVAGMVLLGEGLKRTPSIKFQDGIKSFIADESATARTIIIDKPSTIKNIPTKEEIFGKAKGYSENVDLGTSETRGGYARNWETRFEAGQGERTTSISTPLSKGDISWLKKQAIDRAEIEIIANKPRTKMSLEDFVKAEKILRERQANVRYINEQLLMRKALAEYQRIQKINPFQQISKPKPLLLTGATTDISPANARNLNLVSIPGVTNYETLSTIYAVKNMPSIKQMEKNELDQRNKESLDAKQKLIQYPRYKVDTSQKQKYKQDPYIVGSLKYETSQGVEPTLDITQAPELKTPQKQHPKLDEPFRTPVYPGSPQTPRNPPKEPPTKKPPKTSKDEPSDALGFRFNKPQKEKKKTSRKSDPWFPASLENVTIEEFTLRGKKRATHIASRKLSQAYERRLVTTGQSIPTLAQSQSNAKSIWRNTKI